MLNTHSPGPFSDHRNVTNRTSTNTNATSNTYQWNTRRNVKISISDYPKFSGKAKDWTIFDRKFTSVVASQGFSYILGEEDFIPMTQEDEATYKEDSAFIYQAFQMCWAESLNFYLVEQNKKEKDGRQVYLDAKKYFRGEAVEDAILNETVANLVTSKLTPNTFNGAEGYNNKFNDNKNQLIQLGYDLPEKSSKAYT
jgi:hypothetical protein